MKVVALLLAPLAAASDWQWVDIEGSTCIDGKQTGVWTRKGAGKNLGVYLYPGGACFNRETCDLLDDNNPHPSNPGQSGIFDSRSDNPLVDYNWMAVPYCTGDVHSGGIAHQFAGGFRNFSGSHNLKLHMQYATQTFKDVNTLFITGESAGGFGALASYITMRDFYPEARGVLMDDSGPILDDDALPVCLQEMWQNAWDLNKNFPADFPGNNDQGNLGSIWLYSKKRYPNDSFSLISSQTDAVISTFFGYSELNCHTLVPVGYTKLQAGLKRLANESSVYMIPGNGHTHTSHGEFYSRNVSGVPLFKWIEQLVDPNQPDPASLEPTSADIWNEIYPRKTATAMVV